MATTQELLAQSTATAQKAAQMIGGTFTQGVGFQPAQTATTPSGAVVNTNTGALVAPKSNIVPSSSLKPSTNPALPDPPPTRQPYDISSLSSIEDQAAAFAARFQEPTTPEDTQKTTIEDKLLAAYEKFNGSSAFKSKAMADAGIPEIDTNIKSVTAQITQLQKESEALKLANRVAGPGGAMTATALNAKDAEIERQRASKALMLSAALDGYNADLASAKSKVETMLENEFGPAQDEIDYLTKQLEIVKERGTAAQKKSAATQEIALQERQRLLDEAKTIKSKIADTVMEASQNGAPASILNKIAAAKTVEEAVIAASGYTVEQDTSTVKLDNGQTVVIDSKTGQIIKNLGGAKTGGGSGGLSSVTQAVIENPALFNNYTPTERSVITSELIANGYDVSGLTGVTLTPAQKEDIAQMNTVKGLISDVLALKNGEDLPGIGAFGLGTIKGLAAQAGLGTESGQKVRSLIGNITGTIAKLRGGTSFTTNEQTLLETYIPKINDDSSVALIKLSLLNDFIERKNADLLATSQMKTTEGLVKKQNASPGATAETLRAKYNY